MRINRLPGERFLPAYKSFAKGFDAQLLTATRLVGWNPTIFPSVDKTTYLNKNIKPSEIRQG